MITIEYVSPCGKLLLGVHGNRVCLCDWMLNGRSGTTVGRIMKYLPADGYDNNLLIYQARIQLDEYFCRQRKEFELPLLPIGTDFQKHVWQALRAVPYAATSTYLNMAEATGNPSAVRAVANAVGANPLSIFIPCHRIIGSNGSLTGYAGGLEAKKYLLELET